MNNPNALTVVLPGFVLNALERYVRACEAFQQTPNNVSQDEFQAALRAYKDAGAYVADMLEAVLADQAVPGTLGEALTEATRNRKAREAAAE
ncbi:hypothetical protein ACF8GD_00235 [Pseudomonas putida]|uniref:hypothetical protein n=1 Tax=Pseudomonas putida TaxID=303 RepID=UPI00370B3548